MGTRKSAAVRKPEIKIVEPVESMMYRPGVRYLVSKGSAEALVDRVLSARPGTIVQMTIEEMRVWRDHVAVING